MAQVPKTIIKRVTVHADGGSRKNPGAAAIGVLVFDDNKNQLDSHKECIGDTTNNVAEYKALIKALQLSAKHTRNEVQVFLDSELVVKQMNGTYRIKAEHLYPLFQEVKNCERAFNKVTYNWVPRTHTLQVQADKLVNEALDGK